MHLLIDEARRLDRVRGRRGGSTDQRWREIGRQTIRSLRRGTRTEEVRAEFAGRFPFLGLVSASEMDASRDRKQRIINRLREQGRLFLTPGTEDALPRASGDASTEVSEDAAYSSDADVTAALSAITAAVTAASAASGTSGIGCPEPESDELSAARWRRWRADLEELFPTSPCEATSVLPGDAQEHSWSWDVDMADTDSFNIDASKVAMQVEEPMLYGDSQSNWESIRMCDDDDTNQVATSRLFTSWATRPWGRG